MRVTKDILEAKIRHYNSISKVKLKLDHSVMYGVNVYTTDNLLISTGKVSVVAEVLDALIMIKQLEK